MIQNVEAVYEHGVLRPLEPLALAEFQRVQLTISEVSGARLCATRSANPDFQLGIY
jgi:predicted DNA-binding antitoxin AbrB/MazE fold protein